MGSIGIEIPGWDKGEKGKGGKYRRGQERGPNGQENRWKYAASRGVIVGNL